LKLPQQDFTYRQYMEASDFELFYYHDNKPPNVGFHNHDFYEIYLFLSGTVTYIIEGKSYRLKPRDILIINNKELHKAFAEMGVPYERIVIWLNPDYMKSLNTDNTNLLGVFDSSLLNRHNLLRLDSEAIDYIYTIVDKLGVACKSNTFGSDILRESYIKELLVYLNRVYQISIGNDLGLDFTYNEKISQVIHFINQNLGEDLSLETISAKFYMSKYHLLREFKKNTGYTMHRYITKKRLIMAKELLKDYRQVSDVCSKCGFGDYSNFIRTFRKEFGVSPKKYCKGSNQ
jgi:AraC-like DNA-binding protein/mannose-6-phosphate isomerase-like protein (cupin superfamily)